MSSRRTFLALSPTSLPLSPSLPLSLCPSNCCARAREQGIRALAVAYKGTTRLLSRSLVPLAPGSETLNPKP